MPTAKLKRLVYALENQSVWPENFSWNYLQTARCAIGLGKKTGVLEGSSLQDHAKELGVSLEKWLNITGFAWRAFPGYEDCPSIGATPERVAAYIRYLYPEVQ